MRSKIFAHALVAFFTFIFLRGSLAAQDTSGGTYPAPRYPDLSPRTQQQLLEIARVVVKKPSLRDQLKPGYDIRKGERALIIVNSNFERPVLDAIVAAIREAGGRPDVLITDAAPKRPAEGWQEIAPFVATDRPRRADTRSDPITLATVGKYDILIQGSGGGIPHTPFRWEYIPWDTVEKFITGAPDFPSEVQELIDRKVWDILQKAKRVRVVDPEGTDLSWSMKPEYFDQIRQHWPGYDVVLKGHVGLSPLQFTPPGFDAKGVVAGTLNHAGTFPAMKLFIEGGKIVRIEGGGRYGELWQQLLAANKDAQVPGFPGAGAGWFQESSLGTNPKIARLTDTLIAERPGWERLRSGIIHFGFGLTISPESHVRAEYDQYMREHPQVADGHFHVHQYFATVEVLTVDDKTIKIIDKGHLTLLDDPEVRTLAAKYGNPDQILREVWVPAVPGINAPGDYHRDYSGAADVWIRNEIESNYPKR
ncbi:MAG: hypothetical protein HY645_00645 [Acidobacteria bacterium]|nr:hypothetical protein [Acidobacteriota bacterium]